MYEIFFYKKFIKICICNYQDGDEVMPSLDSTRNLRSMFESKAQEASKVQVRDRPKVNRFVVREHITLAMQW